MRTIAQKDVQMNINDLNRKRTIEIKLKQGEALLRLPSGYVILQGEYAGGIGRIKLEPGEILHQVPEGWIIQPAGNPGMSITRVANFLQKSTTWIYKLSQRGPLDRNLGLQGYVPNPEAGGAEFIPKLKPISGAEIFYYRSDIEAYEEYRKAHQEAKGYPKPEEEMQLLMEVEVPEGIFNLFKKLGEQEQAEHGYVTKTRVRDEARAVTMAMTQEQLAEIGLERPVLGGHVNYLYLKATAVQLGWGDNPRRAENTSAYRRTPRDRHI